ncbi:MAG: tetratricopeptide repeat protein [Acidiferrobacteraceae bacterium]
MLRKQGHPRRAREAYESALRHIHHGTRYSSILKMKLEDLPSGPA